MTGTRLRAALAVVLALASFPSVPAAAAPPAPVPAGPPAAAGVIVRDWPARVDSLGMLGFGLGPAAHGSRRVLRVPAGRDAADYARELLATGKAAAAEPNYVRYPLGYTATPDDPDFADGAEETFYGTAYPHARSWQLRGSGSAGFDGMWPSLAADGDATDYHARTGASGVPVAIIDTGFYLDHPDRGNIVAGKDCFESYDGRTGTLVRDDDVTPAPVSALQLSPNVPNAAAAEAVAAHGTCTAMEVSAATGNGRALAGASYDSLVRVYKVQGVWVDGNPAGGFPAGSAVIFDAAIIDAIYRATDDGCRVISMSLGGSAYSQAMKDAVDYAWAHGVLVVAATGNTGREGVLYPAAYDHVLGVGAYGLAGPAGQQSPVMAPFSSWGAGTDIMAPGVGIWGATRPGYDADGDGPGSVPGYTWWQGTSMAAPLAAAAASDLWRLVPDLGPDEVAGVLEASAADMDAPGTDAYTGWGQLDAAAAAAALRQDYPALSKPSLGTVPAAVPTRTVSVTWQPVTGYDVSYRVAIDGVEVTQAAGTSYAFSGLADGPHNVAVAAASVRNWHADSTSTVSFTVDTQAPEAPGVSWDQAGRRVLWTSAEPAGTGVAVSLDGTSTPAYLTGGSGSWVVPATVAAGPHAAYVRLRDAAGNIGPWTRLGFTIGSVPASAVRLPDSILAQVPTATVAWEGLADATSYDVSLNGGPAVSTTGTTAVVGPLAPHANTVTVVARNAVGPGPSASTTVNYELPVPATPIPQAAGTAGTTVTVAWESCAYAQDYEIRLNGAVLGSTEATSYAVGGLLPGSNKVEVRSRNFSAASGWGSVTAVRGSQPVRQETAVTLVGPAGVAWTAKAALAGTLTAGGVPAAGLPVLVERSYDGLSWSVVATVTTGAGGRWTLAWPPGRTVVLRASFAGDPLRLGSVSGTSTVLQYAYVGKPSFGSYRGHGYFTVTGDLKPRRPSGSRLVRVYAYRKSGGAWKLHSSFLATLSNRSSWSRYAVRVSLPHDGSWKLVAAYAGDGTVARTTGASAYLSVR